MYNVMNKPISAIIALLTLSLCAYGQGVTPGVPGTAKDIATPSVHPAAGRTKFYTKAGKLCAEDSSGGESCTGGSGVGVQINGAAQGSQSNINFGATMTTTCASGTCTTNPSTSVFDTRNNAVLGTDRAMSVITGTGAAYVGCPTGNTGTAGAAITALQPGSVVMFKPNVNSTGGATTFTICALSAIAIKLANGTSNPTSSTFLANQWYKLTYDGTSLCTDPGSAATGGTRYIQIPLSAFLLSTNATILVNNFTGGTVATYGTLWAGAISAVLLPNTSTPAISAQFVIPPDMDLTQAVNVDFLMGTDAGGNGNARLDLGFDCVPLNTQLSVGAHTFTNTANTGTVAVLWLQQKSVKISFASLSGCATDQMAAVNIARNNSVSGNAAGGLELWFMTIEYKSLY